MVRSVSLPSLFYLQARGALDGMRAGVGIHTSTPAQTPRTLAQPWSRGTWEGALSGLQVQEGEVVFVRPVGKCLIRGR